MTTVDFICRDEAGTQVMNLTNVSLSLAVAHVIRFLVESTDPECQGAYAHAVTVAFRPACNLDNNFDADRLLWLANLLEAQTLR